VLELHKPPPIDLADAIARAERHLAALRARARDALIVAIVRVVGSRCFTASEVIAHAPLDPGLASALRAAGATNAVRLGKRLKGVAGQAVRGVRVEHIGDEREGAVWVVRLAPESARFL